MFTPSIRFETSKGMYLLYPRKESLGVHGNPYIASQIGLRVHIFGEKWGTASGGLGPPDPLPRCKLVASYALVIVFSTYSVVSECVFSCSCYKAYNQVHRSWSRFFFKFRSSFCFLQRMVINFCQANISLATAERNL